MADTVTQTTVPWGPQGGGLEYGFGKARSIFDTQFGNPFPGYSGATQASLAGMQAIASGNNPFLGPTTDAITGVASGNNAIGTGGMFGDIYSQAMDANGFNQQVTNNPYADAVLSQQQDDIANRVKSAYSVKGRYGSNDFTGKMVDSLGANANEFNLGRYDIDSRNALSRMGVGLSAAQGQTGVQSENIANRLAAAGMAPAASEFRYADPMRLAQVGAAQDLQQQSEQQYPWDLLTNYQSMFGSIPGSAGVSQQEGPEQSSWLSALGGAATGAGIGSMFGPVGTAVGAGLGGLGSWLFG